MNTPANFFCKRKLLRRRCHLNLNKKKKQIVLFKLLKLFHGVKCSEKCILEAINKTRNRKLSWKMSQRSSKSNPLTHLINRQNGTNISNFRMKLYKERLNVAKNLYKKDLRYHFGCVNAIEFSKEGNYLVSGKTQQNQNEVQYIVLLSINLFILNNIDKQNNHRFQCKLKKSLHTMFFGL